MRFIPLTQGKFAIVDDEDYEVISKHKWFANLSPKDSTFYAKRNIMVAVQKQAIVCMHRHIAGLAHGDRRVVDHIDGDGLNNQKLNLRICDHKQNTWNQRLSKSNTSGFKGVSLSSSKRGARWVAGIRIEKRRIHLGVFDSPVEAHEAYRIAAEKHFGEFARCK